MDQLYGLDVDFVDWRRFLLCVALPWPCPSVQELLEAWEAVVPEAERETVGKKTITKPEFEATEIWLDRPLEELPVEGFNRNSALKDVRRLQSQKHFKI